MAVVCRVYISPSIYRPLFLRLMYRENAKCKYIDLIYSTREGRETDRERANKLYKYSCAMTV